MSVPISKRLLTAANMVDNGAKVADIGCDHGYLGIYLLLTGQASFVYASDLRTGPLGAAKRNAEKFGVTQKMEFVCADGFAGIDPDKVDTLICCGMGGDLIRKMIEKSPWVCDSRYTLILQPQAGQAEFRKWLAGEGFSILEEQPVFDDRFIYAAMKIRYTGDCKTLSPGESYVTKQMLTCGSEDLPKYLERVLDSLEKSITGMEISKNPGEKLDDFKSARSEILEMRERLYEGQ